MQKPRPVDQYAFSNSVILRPGTSGTTTFEDGSPISDELRLKLFEVTNALSLMLEWKQGDVLMIDNLRMMHGRAAFKKDDARRILVKMGDESFA
jgi:alpha-ketoglutarate-dependent taurine dioxygenase